MHHMTGVELAGELLSIRSDIPIILCTGFSEIVTPGSAKSMDMSTLLMKPILLRDLAETVREVPDRKM